VVLHRLSRVPLFVGAPSELGHHLDGDVWSELRKAKSDAGHGLDSLTSDVAGG
jgi:hypothetical protein